MPTIKIHNIETDEVIEREMNDAELAQWEADKAQSEAREQAKAEAAEKRELALAKLAGLGLDTEDLKALGL